jgi:hypothetical protein
MAWRGRPVIQSGEFSLRAGFAEARRATMMRRTLIAGRYRYLQAVFLILDPLTSVLPKTAIMLLDMTAPAQLLLCHSEGVNGLVA